MVKSIKEVIFLFALLVVWRVLPMGTLREHTVAPTPENFQQQISYATPNYQRLALSTYLSAKYNISSSKVSKYVYEAWQVAAQENISPLLVVAMMQQESSLNPKAHNAYGAKGLLQVVPRFHKKLLSELHVQNLYAPHENILAGTRILASYLRQERGNLVLALQRYGGSKTYSDKVLAKKEELQSVIDWVAGTRHQGA